MFVSNVCICLRAFPNEEMMLVMWVYMPSRKTGGMEEKK